MAGNNEMTISQAFEIIENKCLCSEPNCKTTGNCKFKHVNNVPDSCVYITALDVIKKELDKNLPHGEWKPENVDHRGYTNHFLCSNCGRDIYLSYYCRINKEFDNCPHCRAIMDL